MRALRFDRFGGLDALALVDLPAPVAAAGEVRVEVRAAGINPSDLRNVQGRFPYTTLPRTPGRDFAGVVVEGPGHLLGAEVWGSGRELGFTRDGTHAEQVVVPAAGVTRKPRALSFEEAASCGVPYTTAWDALERSGVGAKTSVLIIGAGAVGSAALGLARARGADPLVAVRRAPQVEALRSGGFRSVLLGDPADPSALAASVREALPGGADVIVDTTGFWLASAVECLATFGRIAVIAAPRDGHVHTPILALYRRGGSIVGVNSLLYDSVACAGILAQVGSAFERGELAKPGAPRAFALAAGLEAYRAVEEGGADKMVLVPG